MPEDRLLELLYGTRFLHLWDAQQSFGCGSKFNQKCADEFIPKLELGI